MSDGETYEQYTELVIAALNLLQVRLYNDNHPENPHSGEDEMLAEEAVDEAAEALLGRAEPSVPAPGGQVVALGDH